MKKRIIFIFFGILFLAIPFAPATAWKNGSYAYNRVDYSYEDDYGTHDWIAEYALDELMKISSSDWDWLNQPDMKKIFCWGPKRPIILAWKPIWTEK